MDRDIMALVTGRNWPSTAFIPARLPGYRRVIVRNEIFPMLIEETASEVAGVVVEDLTPEDLDRILFFESVEYEPRTSGVLLEEGRRVSASLFGGSSRARHDGVEWSYETWVRNDKEAQIEQTLLWMGFYGYASVEEADGLWDAALASGMTIEQMVRKVRGEPDWSLARSMFKQRAAVA